MDLWRVTALSVEVSAGEMKLRVMPSIQGRNEVRWRPGQETSLAPPCSNLRSFGSNCTVLKKVFVAFLGVFGAPTVIRCPGNCAPLASLVTPLLLPP